MNFDDLQAQATAAIGRSVHKVDRADLSPVARMQATLDRDDPPPQPGDPVPPGWHWLYFLSDHQQSALGPDGHAARGEFLPSVPLPRRMWAGGDLIFHRPIRVGEDLQQTATIRDARVKQGRSGILCFVTVEHVISGEDGPATTEMQTLVFREDAGATAPPSAAAATPPIEAAPPTPIWQRRITPDPVLLFRFSALTFNGHRIHYDQPYTTGVEGYPGLIVHGPLLAMLLIDLLRRQRPDATIQRFQFRALRPVFDVADFQLSGALDGSQATLWVTDHEGHIAMRGLADISV